MTNSEMIEFAAKAAGWKSWRSKHGYWNLTSPEGGKHVCCQGWPSFDERTGEKLPEPTLADALLEAGWHPLTDEGDRYRLIKACGLNVNFANKTVKAYVDGREHRCYYFGDHPDHEAERIVRAAAEIGKAMAASEAAGVNSPACPTFPQNGTAA